MNIKKKLVIFFIKLTRFLYQKLHKFKSFENSKIKDYFHLLWIILIGSNHSRRYKIFIDSSVTNDRKKDFTSLQFNSRDTQKIFIVLGDSHAEYYGRNFNNDKKIKFLSVWLGPLLLLNYCKSKKHIDRTFFFLKKIINFFGKEKKYYLIISLGEIDIRSSYYQFLKIHKLFKNLDEITSEYISSLNDTLKLIQKNFKNIKIFFKEPTPTTNKTGYNPLTLEEVNNITKNDKFPALGSIVDRAGWHLRLVESLKKDLDKNFFFASINSEDYNKFGAINENFSDDHHILDNDSIQKFQKKLINEKGN